MSQSLDGHFLNHLVDSYAKPAFFQLREQINQGLVHGLDTSAVITIVVTLTVIFFLLALPARTTGD